MNKQTQNLIDEVVKNWDSIKTKQVIKKEDYGSGFESPIGNIYWDNPKLIFVLVTNNQEDYEGSQTQIGITKERKLRWEYQSHCSCNGYEDSSDAGAEFPPLEKKSYELDGVPLDWEEKIAENIKKILK